MAASNKSITVIGSSAVATSMTFRRETVGGNSRIRATIDGTTVDNTGAVVELTSANLLLPAGSPVETQVLALMNGAALTALRSANGLES